MADNVIIGIPVLNKAGQAVLVLNRELNADNQDVVIVAVRLEVITALNLTEISPKNYKRIERKSNVWAYFESNIRGELAIGLAQNFAEKVGGVEISKNNQYSHPFGMKTQVNGQLTALVSYRMAISEFEVHVFVDLKAKESKSLIKKLIAAGYKSHGAESGWEKFVEIVPVAQANSYKSVTDYVYHEVHMALANSYKPKTVKS